MINRTSIKQTTGTKTTVSQSFSHNIFFDALDASTSPFIFDVPQYTTVGGTKDYYGQNPLAIFTNLVLPFIRFDFSANTESFGTDVLIKHDFYRVSWDTFSTVKSGLKSFSDESIQSENFIEETIEETDSDGNVNKRVVKKSTVEVNNVIKSSRKPTGRDSIEGSKKVTKPTIADVQTQLDNPVFSITAATTGITTSIYDLQIDQFVKNLGELKTELFQDRDQYIIDTNFIFDKTSTVGLTDLKTIDGVDGSISDGVYKSTDTIETITEKQTISDGYFKGLDFKGGEYFSFFEVPDKPIFEYPTPSGQINTFTPEVFWTNGENADEYLIQVNYNTGDTGFTGTVFTYIVPKSDEFKEEAVSKTKGSDTEFTTTKTIRKYQLSLKSNKCLIYRVGNVKVIKNLFDVRQSVVTFSDNKSVCTQAEPIGTYVYTENDSPHILGVAGLESPPSLDAESPLSEYTLSGTVSGSTVSGATMQLIYPNSSFVTVPTNTDGSFEFEELEAGTYTLNTTYRGYAADSRQIVISSDTNVLIELRLIWGNIYDNWASKSNDIIKY